jgi:hypothetical protein
MSQEKYFINKKFLTKKKGLNDSNKDLNKGSFNGAELDLLSYIQENTTQSRQESNNTGSTTQGYFALLSSFYFTPGLATETTIITEQENTWVDVNIVPFNNGANEGTFDYRPQAMIDAQSTAYNESTGIFNLEGLTIESFITFESSFGFIPDVDESQIEVRLLFQRHSGSIPSDDFEKTGNVIPLTQGADIEYSLQPLITAFIGDTIDTNGIGDSGTCKFQIKSSSSGVVKMKQLTWYLNK